MYARSKRMQESYHIVLDACAFPFSKVAIERAVKSFTGTSRCQVVVRQLSGTIAE